ncbi:hypothetical protein V6138_20395, partial [Klebsiella pneumoniae]
MLVGLYVTELSCLTTFAPYQDVAIIGEKDSCIVLVNHNPKSPRKLLYIKGSSLVVVAEGMIMVYLIARGHRHGR